MPVLQRISSGSSATFVSEADTRVKIAISFLASLMTIVIVKPEAQMVLFIFSAAYVFSMRRPLLVFAAYAGVAALLTLAYACALFIKKLFPAMPSVTFTTMLVPFLRLMIMVNVILPLAFATRVQSLLGSLKSFRLPFCLYIPLTVMVRFIPTCIFDMKQIMEALQIRGFSLSPKQFILHPVLCIRFISVPLLFRSLKTSEDLGIAAELKGLNATRRHVPYKKAVWQKRDTVLLAVALAVAVLALLCNIYLGGPAQRIH